MNLINAFDEPIFVTRPVLPQFETFVERLKVVFDSKWLTNGGSQSVDLAHKLQAFLGVPNVSLFCNGTLALQLACKALEITGEVITTPFTFVATAHALSLNNLHPVFCDIEPGSYNIDPHKIEQLITKKTSAILPVHVFGNPCAVEDIKRIADKYNLKVLYDAAHAFGVEFDDVPIGKFGDISMFSFHATKIFSTIEGGALTFSDSDLVEKLYFLKNFGIKNEEEIVGVGTNAKMNELQSAFGLAVLDKINIEIAKRKHLTELYRDRLKDVPGIVFLDIAKTVKYNYQYMPIRVCATEYGMNRDGLCAKLKKHNVYARKYFFPLLSNIQCYKSEPSAAKDRLIVANTVAEEILCLPLYGDLGDEIIEKICEMIRVWSASI